VVGTRLACRALGLSRATIYRSKIPAPLPRRRRVSAPISQLSLEERSNVLACLHSERFADSSPVTVYYTLLDEGLRLCSIRTMYRLLAQEEENVERRYGGRRLEKAKKPELLAERPNQLWSWDITLLRGPERGVWFYLYVVLDVFSRRVVGWLLARCQSGELATQLILDACRKEGIPRGQLTLHADRGGPMKSQSVVGLLSWLGVEKSYSRPSISNDNPYSEACFKTLKYCPAFPDRFGSFEDAVAFMRHFFVYYNSSHFHSGICYLPPDAVHYGLAEGVLERRHQVELASYELHPDRYPRGAPRLKCLPKAVWINQPWGQTEALKNESHVVLN